MLFELKTPVTYTENKEIKIEQQGTYQIELFGASGNGGQASGYNEIKDNGTVNILIAAGGGGGGGGYFSAKIEMSINDQINFTAGKVGNTTSAKIIHNLEECEINISTGRNGGDGVTDNFQSLKGGNGGLGGEVEYNENNFFNEIIANKNGSYGAAGQTNEDNITPSDADSYPVISVEDALGGDGGCPGVNEGGSGAGGNKHYFTNLTKLRTPGSGQNGFIRITLIEEDNNNTSIETLKILNISSIKELKRKVNEEVERREFFGNISSLASWETNEDGSFKTDSEEKKIPKLIGINQNDPVTANNINTNIINPINYIFINEDNEIEDGLSIEQINNPIIYTYINDKLDKLDDFPDSDIYVKDAAHGCKNMCTGFCSSTCSDMCTGCGETARGKTSNTSGGPGDSDTGSRGSYGSGCSSSCGAKAGACTGSCNTDCISACTGQAAGDGCSSACGASCYAVCGWSCELSCQTGCKNACKEGCSGCSGGCKGQCGSSCTGCSGGCGDSCGNCDGYCKNFCTHNCAESCTGSSYST